MTGLFRNSAEVSHGASGALPPAGGRMRGGGGVRVGVGVGVAKACAVSVACANWALIVAKKLGWSKGTRVAVGQTGKGVLVTMYPPSATTVATKAVALKSTAG
jgi:hypothetical protein